jgi:radical SAM superfamily enzyme YgiQ (UPF0313 family)
MRAAILYPPIFHEGRIPILTQSRIFSFTHSAEISIYPLVMAQAATLLQKGGWEVAWMDGIAEGKTPGEFNAALDAFSPDLVVLETKVTMVRAHWKYIDELKKRSPRTRVVLVGDHPSFFPEESMNACQVDYIATGGDYDAGIERVARILAGELQGPPAGVWHRDGSGKPVPGGPFAWVESLDALPWIDRKLTRWDMYGEAYLHRPVAYILSGRGCGARKRPGMCTFCIWQYAFWDKKARLRNPRDVAREIASLVRDYGVREVFDDNEAGAMWDLSWLGEFTDELEKTGVAGRVAISSNCRADSINHEACELMKRCGFRLLKIGLESGNDETLKRLAKDETVDDIRRGVKMAKDYGFAVMVTVMTGFPWETEEMSRNSWQVAKELLLYKAKGGDCLEANVIIPYPGTPLHKYVMEQGWFTIDPADYDQYGMSLPIVKYQSDPVAWCKRLWKLHHHPLFLLRSALSVRTLDDLKLGFRGIRSLLGHEKDYSRKKS